MVDKVSKSLAAMQGSRGIGGILLTVCYGYLLLVSPLRKMPKSDNITAMDGAHRRRSFRPVFSIVILEKD
jgi:hypothetical protein